MKIYISGPIGGMDQDECAYAFKEACRIITQHGHTPVNPLTDGDDLAGSFDEHLVSNISLMLGADAIMMLYGWGKSKVCRIEHFIAMNVGKIVFTSFGSLKNLNK